MKNKTLFWWSLFIILLAIFAYLLRDGIWIYSDANASGEWIKDWQLRPEVTYLIIFLLALSLEFIIWFVFLLIKWLYNQCQTKYIK